MSIAKSRFLGFILALFCALPLVLCVGGCEEQTNNTQPSTEEAVSNTYQMVQQKLYEFNNYRADITCRYNYRHTDADSIGSTVKDEAATRSMQLHVGEDGIYFYVQPQDELDPIIQASFLGDAIYKYGDTTDVYDVPSGLDVTGVTGVLIYYFVQNGFIDFADLAQSLDTNALTINNSNEKITLTARLNLKNFATQFIDNCATNEDEQIITFLNEFIKDAFNKNTSVQALVSDFCDAYTKQTTVGDLVNYIQTTLGVNLSQPVVYAFDIIAYANGVSISELTTNTPISEIIQNDKTGAELKESILNKLSANDLTLANILDGTYVSDSEVVNKILEKFASIVNTVFDLYAETNAPTANDMVASWSVVMNKQYVFESMELKLLGNLSAADVQNSKQASTAIDCSVNIAFTNIGITDVNYPSVIDNATFNNVLDLGTLDATATQYEIDLSDYPPFSADLDFYADVASVPTLVATYDVATRLFVVEIQYLKDVYIAGDNEVTLTATDAATQGVYTFKFKLQNSTI